MAFCLSSAGSSSIVLGEATFDLRDRSRSPTTTRRKAPQLACPCPSASSSSSSSSQPDEDSPRNSGLMNVLEHANRHLAKVALATAVAGLVIFSPAGDALAAKSGGRVGGQAFRSAPPPSARPRIDNSRRTNIYVNPPSFGAPPLLGGYGSPYFGGWGWSPFSFFTPGPSIAVGVGGGFNLFGFLLLMAFAASIFNLFRRRDDDDYYD